MLQLENRILSLRTNNMGGGGGKNREELHHVINVRPFYYSISFEVCNYFKIMLTYVPLNLLVFDNSSCFVFKAVLKVAWTFLTEQKAK